ncbi:MAG: preprotein translocase subunit YajC [Bacillota bacterium]
MDNTGNFLLGLWPWLLLLGLIYFMMIRPQQKREKERQEMLSSLRVGDEVVTIGGLHGTITALRENIIHLEIAEDLEVTFSKMAVASKLEDEFSESATEPEPAEDIEDPDRS